MLSVGQANASDKETEKFCLLQIDFTKSWKDRTYFNLLKKKAAYTSLYLHAKLRWLALAFPIIDSAPSQKDKWNLIFRKLT